MAEEEMDQLMTDEQMVKFINSMLSDGVTLREAKGITDEELETVYAMGVDYYKAGNYVEARKIFRFLAIMHHTSSRFWTALGSVDQATKKYDNAIKAYQVAAFFDLHYPNPQYNAAVCFRAKGDLVNARRALRSLEMFAPKDTEAGRAYLAKGRALMEKLESEEANQGKEA